MIFSPALVEKVLDGRKSVTRRLAKGKPCTYRVGQDYAVQRSGEPGKRASKELGRILITSIAFKDPPFPYQLEDSEVKAEGFDSQAALWRFWDQLHGGERDMPVYRIEFVRVAV